MNSIDFGALTPISQMRGEDNQEQLLLQKSYEAAVQFLSGFSWCGGILDSYFGLGIGGVVAVFLFRIRPAKIGVDECLWVVTGDLPPAYLVTDNAPNPVGALRGYIEEMKAWVAAVKAGKPIQNLIPVNTPPTEQYANMLEARLTFLSEKVLPEFDGE